jgi:hypothetical protein
MNRRLLIAASLLALLGTACRGIAPGAPDPAASDSPSMAAAPPSVTSSAGPPAGCELGMGIAE